MRGDRTAMKAIEPDFGPDYGRSPGVYSATERAYAAVFRARFGSNHRPLFRWLPLSTPTSVDIGSQCVGCKTCAACRVERRAHFWNIGVRGTIPERSTLRSPRDFSIC